jgi:hypothetical protein
MIHKKPPTIIPLKEYVDEGLRMRPEKIMPCFINFCSLLISLIKYIDYF